jgi:polyisoprenoid-binding protein YceI
MKKINILLAMLLFAAGSAFAQTTWTIDKAHSKIGFNVTHMAVSEVEGNFKDFDASLVTKSDDFSGAEITFTAKTASIDTDIERRDNHLRSPDSLTQKSTPSYLSRATLSNKAPSTG